MSNKFMFKYLPGAEVLFTTPIGTQEKGKVKHIRIGADITKYEIETEAGTLFEVEEPDGYPRTVTEEDLKENPELEEGGVKAGDTVGIIPAEDEDEE